MSDQEKTVAAAGAEAKAKINIPELSPAEIQDQLDRYDGFEELLAPLADNLDKFSPEKKSKKRRYLQDDDLIDERRQLKERLEAYLSFLGDDQVENHKQIRNLAQEKLEKNEDLISENLAQIFDDCRDVERTYRELEMFFRNAAPTKVKNLTLVNAHPEVLTDADSNLLYNYVEKRISDESRNIDQTKAYSTLVIPNLWRSKQPKALIERYAKLAGDARVSFITDFEDVDSVEEALDEREAKRWAGFTGSELFHSKLVVMANHLVLRGKHEGVDEEDDELRGSPAMAIAGKMYAEKISQPIMGEMHGSVTGSQGLAFRTVQDEVADLSDQGMNGMTHQYEKDMAYDSCTAFTGGEYALKRYPVVRTFDYVNRVLRHYLGKVTGQQLDRTKANQVRDTVQSFLDDLAEQKIINKGKVTYFDWNSKIPDRIDINIDITPLWAVRTFVYALKAKNKSVESELN
ncbi:MAG: hypothetical protein AAF828_00680 [Bacteroidota bacterium]